MSVRPEIVTKPIKLLVVKEGDTAQISCEVLTGHPAPKLIWRTPVGVIDGANVRLSKTYKEQAGEYVCEADNGFDKMPVTSTVVLIVECK